MEEGKSLSDWNRLWIVINNVEVKTMIREDTKYIEIGDISMKIEARQMEKDSKGELVDKKVQDKTAASYRFAEKFTHLYDKIA